MQKKQVSKHAHPANGEHDKAGMEGAKISLTNAAL